MFPNVVLASEVDVVDPNKRRHWRLLLPVVVAAAVIVDVVIVLLETQTLEVKRFRGK